MDINVEYVVKALLINGAFLASLGIVMTILVRLLVKPEDKRASAAVVWSVLLVVGFVWLWGVAYMNFPSVDRLIGNVLTSAAAVAPRVESLSSSVREKEMTLPDKDTSSASEAISNSVAEEEISFQKEGNRLWGEGTPRGRRGHIDDL